MEKRYVAKKSVPSVMKKDLFIRMGVHLAPIADIPSVDNKQ